MSLGLVHYTISYILVLIKRQVKVGVAVTRYGEAKMVGKSKTIYSCGVYAVCICSK